jgi:predicted TIM-barrel fold metal-dependent hydrolase
MRIIDGDSHFVEPLDLFERHIDPAYRERALRLSKDPASGTKQLIIDGKPLQLLDVDTALSSVAGYGEKEAGRAFGNYDRHLAYDPDWQNMDKRVHFLEEEGIDAQVIYPSLGLLWEGVVADPKLADAHCRAYNTWALELCATHKDRLYPTAHLSLRDPQLAVRELERVAKLGCRTAFVGAAPVNGRSFGHPDFDPVWATAQNLNVSISIHIVGHTNFLGSQWYQDRDPGFMFFGINVSADARMALTTMVYDGVFERFPRLRVATVEAQAGWVGEWLERLDYFYSFTGHTSQMKRPASEYFAQNIWIDADPREKMLPLVVQFAGSDKFFIGSDYPHSEGFMHPVQKAREVLATLPAASVEKILGTNAATFFGI